MADVVTAFWWGQLPVVEDHWMELGLFPQTAVREQSPSLPQRHLPLLWKDEDQDQWGSKQKATLRFLETWTTAELDCSFLDLFCKPRPCLDLMNFLVFVIVHTQWHRTMKCGDPWAPSLVQWSSMGKQLLPHGSIFLLWRIADWWEVWLAPVWH